MTRARMMLAVERNGGQLSMLRSLVSSCFTCGCNNGGAPTDDSSFSSCLDRQWVQKEIRWAQASNKKIVTVVEKDSDHSPFDFEAARAKYSGTEWEFILSLSAIEFHRDDAHAETMMHKILTQAGLCSAEERPTSTQNVTAVRSGPLLQRVCASLIECSV